MAGAMTIEAARAALADLPDWVLSDDGRTIRRRWTVRNFARAQGLAQLAGWLAEEMNHHPDIAYGWGWCEIALTSHDAGGLTGRDIDAARRLDAITGAGAAAAGSPGVKG